MSIKKFLVAGFAVVGMVGMVSAQTVVTGGQKLTSPPTGQMEVSYNVSYEASMTVTSNSLSGNALLAGSVATVGGASTAPGGNIGKVVITTNYPLWDVEVAAANKLRLKKGNPPDPGAWNPPPSTEDSLNISLGGASPAPAQLKVYIGIVTGSSFQEGSYADFTSALANGGRVSFADIIGTAIDDKLYNGQEGANGTDGIADVGFVTPAADAEVTFFVNGTIGEPTDKIRGNTEGVYRETLTYTMIAGY